MVNSNILFNDHKNFVLTQLEYSRQITRNLKFHFPNQTKNSWKPCERLLIRIHLVSNKKNPLEELKYYGLLSEKLEASHSTQDRKDSQTSQDQSQKVGCHSDPVSTHSHSLWGYRSLCCYFILEHLPSTSRSALSALALTWPNICMQFKWEPSSVPSTTSKWPEEKSD